MAFQTVDERLESIKKKLAKYTEGEVGLPPLVADPEAKIYLNLDIDMLRKYNPDEIAEIAFMLAKCALNIQQRYDQQSAIVHWAESSQNYILAKKVDNYSGYSYEERKNKAIHDNELTAQIEQIRVSAKCNMLSIQKLAEGVKYMSDRLNDLKFTRLKLMEE